MHLYLKILCAQILLLCVACNPAQNDTYRPSIGLLADNETLVMKYRACHSGCTKGVVRFKNGRAKMGRHSLDLTSKEVSDLDAFLLLGEKIGSESLYCSLTIKISFKKKKFLRTLNKTGTQIYPCFHKIDDPSVIKAELLVIHLQEKPDETPYWRLSPVEQEKALRLY